MKIKRGVDTLCNVRRLLVDIDFYLPSIGTDSAFWCGVADFTDDITGDFFIVNADIRRDFSGDDDSFSGSPDFNGCTGRGGLSESGV